MASSSHRDVELRYSFLSKKLTHICFAQLTSINEYLVIDWDPKRPSAVT